jgi:hypothetical protein
LNEECDGFLFLFFQQVGSVSALRDGEQDIVKRRFWFLVHWLSLSDIISALSGHTEEKVKIFRATN